MLLQKCLHTLDIRKAKTVASILNPKNDADHYFSGLIEYLAVDIFMASEYYKRSNKHPWPFYDKLIEIY